MRSNAVDVPIVHNRASQRFETTVNGQLTVAEYQRNEKSIVFTHTEVPQAFEGHGIGGALAQAALEYARAEDLVVVPRCPFVASYIRRHPDYLPLVRATG